jgi:hypothetical protein
MTRRKRSTAEQLNVLAAQWAFYATGAADGVSSGQASGAAAALATGKAVGRGTATAVGSSARLATGEANGISSSFGAPRAIIDPPAVGAAALIEPVPPPEPRSMIPALEELCRGGVIKKTMRASEAHGKIVHKLEVSEETLGYTLSAFRKQVKAHYGVSTVKVIPMLCSKKWKKWKG